MKTKQIKEIPDNQRNSVWDEYGSLSPSQTEDLEKLSGMDWTEMTTSARHRRGEYEYRWEFYGRES